jgi:hypothetical protein
MRTASAVRTDSLALFAAKVEVDGLAITPRANPSANRDHGIKRLLPSPRHPLIILYRRVEIKPPESLARFLAGEDGSKTLQVGASQQAQSASGLDLSEPPGELLEYILI